MTRLRHLVNADQTIGELGEWVSRVHLPTLMTVEIPLHSTIMHRPAKASVEDKWWFKI